jgi:hypothetical protein
MIDSRSVEDDAPSTAQSTDTLVCIECGTESTGGPRGWRAYLLEDDLLIYCPACSAREFEDAE